MANDRGACARDRGDHRTNVRCESCQIIPSCSSVDASAQSVVSAHALFDGRYLTQ